MRILSWDVGIRNAAFCLRERYLKVDKSGRGEINYRTITWGLVDLLDRFEVRCHCGRTAMWVSKTGTKVTGWCGQHVGAQGVVPCKKSLEKCHCGKKAYLSVKGRSKLNYCVEHNDLPKLKRYKKVSSKKFSIDVLKEVLIGELEKRLDFLLVDYVVIENQPSLTNPKMKAISETLYHWFVMRGKVDRSIHYRDLERAESIAKDTGKVPIVQSVYRYPSCVRSVEFINPNAKIPDRKITRVDRKAKIMEICERDIKGTEWEDYYHKHPKRDDLADCHVQASVIFTRLTNVEEWKLDEDSTSKWLEELRSRSKINH